MVRERPGSRDITTAGIQVQMIMKRTVRLRVQPRAKQEKVVDMGKDEFKVYTTRPAEDGKANTQVVKLLAGYLGLKRNQITIVKGNKSRDKIVEIAG